MTLGPIDDPIEAVVTETLSQAVQRQAQEIERLRGCIQQMRTAAQLDDWETFDKVASEALDD